MSRALPNRILISLVLFVSSLPALQAAEPSCPPSEALLQSSDPVYAEATALAQELEGHGFQVRCMFPSKVGSIFEVEENGALHSTIEGETCFRTNFGDVTVFFVPKPHTFDDFQIAEKRKDRGYVYRFTGNPRTWAGDKFMFGTAYRQAFLKRDNQLFLVNYDGDLRARLEDLMHLKP
jgi:hypothetical protein